MKSIRIDVLPQEDIWTYYLGYYLNNLKQGYPFANTQKEPALVCITKEDIPKNADKIRVKEQRLEEKGNALNIVKVSYAEGSVQKRLEYVFDKYEVHHLFNLTGSNIAGAKQWKTANTQGLVLDIDTKFLEQQHRDSLFGWPYFFMLGDTNLYPPVFHPKVCASNTTILKAFAMSLDSDIEIENSTQYTVLPYKFNDATGKFSYGIKTE